MPRFFRLSSCSLAITLVLSSAAIADPAAKSHSDTLKVIGSRSAIDSFKHPGVVTVIDASMPQKQTATTAGEMLQNVPGVTVTGAGRTNGQNVNIRGYDQYGVLILIDGIRQGIKGAHFNGTFLDPALIKKVSVIRSPSTSLFGSGALGGAIAYQTVDAADLLAKDQNFAFRISGFGASGYHSTGLGMSVFGRTENLDGIFAFSKRKVGNIYHGNGSEAPNDEAINNLILKTTTYLSDSQSLTTALRYYNNRALEPRMANQSAPNPNMNINPMMNRSTIQRDAELTYRLQPQQLDWLDATAQLYYTEINVSDDVRHEGYGSRKQATRGIKLENRSRLFTHSPVAHQLTYGVESYQQQQIPKGVIRSFPPAEINFASGWLQNELTLRDLPVTLLAGTRFNRYKNSRENFADKEVKNWSSRGAVTVNPTDWLMLFGAYSQAFRTPTLAELYNDSIHFSIPNKWFPVINRWKPNPNLKPESNVTREAGFGLQFDNLLADNDSVKFKTSYFHIDAKDRITSDVSMMASTYINIPRSKSWGWDASLDYQNNWFDWNLAYNRTRGINLDTRKFINSINPDTVTSRLNVPIANSGLSTGWIVTMAENTKFMKDNDAKNSSRKPNKPQAGYAVHDFYLSYRGQGRFKSVTTTAVLGNAFNKAYYSPQAIPQDGRNAKLLISYQW
ncbi:TonB-dependent hemoglobin/transferrin/lactoferrin family receptor [Yersinia enterocolitica]|uniref:TonB-dependent hemoglobin/transferrin/lactoferrin family receptor n=1 Tax=Yersinia enterocolitica TaxID=630 RepID=UPI0005E2BBE9|nr:TonB-dependent hemoglobin/transferrin/lactoferrin family receptor [Yersinia enterocolitica]EKN4021790.1 TonB-dependent hemoglobin/transferrin/lactoferrin family receptor [Yersinia enterocolitica]EKN4085459.1 TonB-dependent hemoglobin/transferrin/lactoferrin family receptor [Yersinia enterocolitica]EKN4168184.1 TonB-dependent hemoglobin/transferrin/lactoferrin family receptor [Yersinia enterocolitica]EKN5126187.1 TonB-dependent hemoglobin/transferrin/lactoferrin family receptor [Yersinia ente